MSDTTAIRLISTRVRRLTTAEVVRSARDVFARGTDLPTPHRDEDAEDDDLLTVSADFMEGVQRIADLVGQVLIDRHTNKAASLSAEEAEVRHFIETYVQHAFRAPLGDADRRRYYELYSIVRRNESFATSLATLVQAALMSARFLYRTELGEPRMRGTTVRLTGHETASALAYFLWGTTPGPELLRAAESGVLTDARGLERYATAMLEDANGSQRIIEARDNGQLLRMAFGRHGSNELRLDPKTEDALASGDRRSAALAIVMSPMFVFRDASDGHS